MTIYYRFCSRQVNPYYNSTNVFQVAFMVNIMLNKNTPGAKKARPSRKHQLALIQTLD